MMERIRLKAPERRRHILETATQLFAERGYHGLTTKDLARRLGITEPVLYQHFTSKETLWSEVKRQCRFPFSEWEHLSNKAAPSTRQFMLITGMLVWGITLGRRPGSLEAVPRHDQILRLLGHGLFETEGPLYWCQEHFSHTILRRTTVARFQTDVGTRPHGSGTPSLGRHMGYREGALHALVSYSVARTRC